MKNVLFGILAITLLAACAREPDPSELVADLAAGKAIAEADCAQCHGMDGRGESTEIPYLAAQSTQYLVEAMHAYRDGGRLHAALQDMTAGMSEQDIINIAGYYSKQPPLKPASDEVVGQTDETSYTEGAAVAAICEDCHGEKGISTEEGIPSLAGQQPAYLIVSTQEYINGSRGHEGQEMLTGLEQVDIEKMAMYFASHAAPLRDAPAFGDPVAGKAASANCRKCHGTRGISSDPLVPSLAGQEPVYLVNAIKAYKNHDRSSDSEMPEKTDVQIENLAAYYSTQKTEASVEDELSGKEMAAKCDRCHSPSSGKRKLSVPSLNGQSHNYLVKAMKEYRREDRDNTMMHKMSSRYSDEMIEVLANYYASQSD
jgi:cytochrome c553